MAISLVYRVILIGLLPLIALLLYLNGQRYDPAIINFASPQISEDAMSSLFPLEVAGFSRSASIRSYTKENLYEYVNGHAEYFISAGFLKLGVAEYALNPKEAPDVTVDIYDMGRSIQAFGLLTDESRGNLSELYAGIKGIKNPLGISFTKGQYYIKISTFNDALSLEDFLEQIHKNITRSSDTSSAFSRLPDLGNAVTTRFIKESYRGLDFVNNVVEREYDVNGGRVQVFLLEGTEKDMEHIIGTFKDYFHDSDISYDEEDKRGSKVYRINDPYEGDWALIALPDALFGIYGSFDNAMINSILKDYD